MAPCCGDRAKPRVTSPVTSAWADGQPLEFPAGEPALVQCPRRTTAVRLGQENGEPGSARVSGLDPDARQLRVVVDEPGEAC